MKNAFHATILSLGALALLTACGGGDGGYKQVERLGRPAINEGLVVTNDYLNAFNSITPSQDLSADAAAVVAEAITVLDAVDQLDGVEHLTATQVALGFLPDVMRFNTACVPANATDANPADGIGTAYYNTAAGCTGAVVDPAGGPAGAILAGGRKLRDDVIDITLIYLVSGLTNTALADDVAYNDNHSALLADFPFMPTPHKNQ